MLWTWPNICFIRCFCHPRDFTLSSSVASWICSCTNRRPLKQAVSSCPQLTQGLEQVCGRGAGSLGCAWELWHCQQSCGGLALWECELWKSHFTAWNLMGLKITYRFFCTQIAYQISILYDFTDRKCSRLSRLCTIFGKHRRQFGKRIKTFWFHGSSFHIRLSFSEIFGVLFFFSLYLSPDSCNIHITLTFLLSLNFFSYIHLLFSLSLVSLATSFSHSSPFFERFYSTFVMLVHKERNSQYQILEEKWVWGTIAVRP